MKNLYRLLLVAVVAVMAVGCGKNEPKKGVNLMDEKVSIRPAEGVKLRADNSAHLSALEIVKQADVMTFITPDKGEAVRGWPVEQKDLTPDAPRLMMWATDILRKNGPGEYDIELNTAFLDAKDVKIKDDKGEIIAYIPNSTIKTAFEQIKTAFDKKDFEAVKQLFDKAYRFTPITTAEWMDLKSKGEQ